jgi:hypothetical protein
MFPLRTPAFLLGILKFPRGTQPCLFGTPPFQAGFAEFGLKWLKRAGFQLRERFNTSCCHRAMKL